MTTPRNIVADAILAGRRGAEIRSLLRESGHRGDTTALNRLIAETRQEVAPRVLTRTGVGPEGRRLPRTVTLAARDLLRRGMTGEEVRRELRSEGFRGDTTRLNRVIAEARPLVSPLGRGQRQPPRDVRSQIDRAIRRDIRQNPATASAQRAEQAAKGIPAYNQGYAAYARQRANALVAQDTRRRFARGDEMLPAQVSDFLRHDTRGRINVMRGVQANPQRLPYSVVGIVEYRVIRNGVVERVEWSPEKGFNYRRPVPWERAEADLLRWARRTIERSRLGPPRWQRDSQGRRFLGEDPYAGATAQGGPMDPGVTYQVVAAYFIRDYYAG